MAKSLTSWLGEFVASELKSTIDWKEAISEVPKIKQDPDCRFSDDGSNLRSSVTGPQLSDNSKVQLLKVVSASNPTIVLISDGATSIRCSLSANAVGTLEDEFDEKLSLDHKGDVVELRAFTMISTPFGPSDRQIQFHIDDLQYEYSLRKVIGEPRPLRQHEGIEPLLDRVREIWSQRYAAEEYQEENQAGDQDSQAARSLHAVGDPRTQDGRQTQQSSGGSPSSIAQSQQSSALHVSPKGAPSLHNGQRQHQPINSSPRDNAWSQRFPTSNSSPSDSSIVHRQTQSRAATQVAPSLRKTAGPSLGKDGFEVATGVNLAQPHGAAAAGARSAKAPPVAVRPDILNLFRPQQSAKSSPQACTSRQTDDASTRTTSKAAPKATSDTDLTISSIVAVTQEPSTSMKRKRASTSGQLPVPYGRRRIPKPQHDLLEKESSWYPALPGRQFPCPNVPIDLLSRWNANVPQAAFEASQRSQAALQSSQASQQRAEAADESNEASEDDSESSEDSDPPYSWDPSPVPKRQVEALPVDSTASSSSSQRRTRHLDPERSSLHMNTRTQENAGAPHLFAPRQSIGSQRHRPNSSAVDLSQTSYDDEHKMSQSSTIANERYHRPSRSLPSHRVVDDRSGRFYAPSSRPPSSAAASHAASPSNSAASSNVKRPTADYDKPMAPPKAPAAYYRSSNHSSGRIYDYRDDPRSINGAQRLPIRSPEKAYDASSRQAPPRSSGAETVIKGTQFSSKGDDIEMDVPRALVDPAQLHRQRRREELGGAQRRHWLLDNYVACSDRRAQIDKVYQVYHRRYPQDRISSTDFARTVFEVFPEIRNGTAQGIRHKDSAPRYPVSAPVRPSQLDGATDPADDDTVVTIKMEREIHEHFKIYEDEPPVPPKRKYIITKQEKPASSSAASAINSKSTELHGPASAAARFEVELRKNGRRSETSVNRMTGEALEADAREFGVDSPLSAMKEFYQAYRNIRPGGAFAASMEDGKVIQRPKKINILGPHWDF